MRPRNAKIFANIMWGFAAGLAFVGRLAHMDHSVTGFYWVVGLVLGTACFATYGSILNEYFTFPAMKPFCLHLVPKNFRPAFIPRVTSQVEAYHAGKQDLKHLVEAVVMKGTKSERLSGIEYLCLIGIPEESVLASLPEGSSTEVSQEVLTIYRHPAWYKLYSLTALFTMGTLFALVANFQWTKALLATPVLALLKVFLGSKWFGE